MHKLPSGFVQIDDIPTHGSNTIGQAVDLATLENGAIDWNKKKGQFDAVAKAMLQAAKELNVKITWGGNWKSLVDKPHFQIEGV